MQCFAHTRRFQKIDILLFRHIALSGRSRNILEVNVEPCAGCRLPGKIMACNSALYFSVDTELLVFRYVADDWHNELRTIDFTEV